MTKPLVSVVIPAYNHEHYITKTFGSLINQTYENMELIVIDDGSSDNTLLVIQDYERKLVDRFSKVIVKSQKNQGICKTLNNGIQLSEGEYIFICPSDDVFSENFVCKQVCYLEENKDYSCSYTDGINLNSSELDIHDYSKGNVFSELFTFKSGDLRWFMLDNYLNLPTPSFIYRASIFEEIGLFDETLKFEDVDMFLRISKYNKMGCINEKLFYRRLHNTNSGRNPDIIIKGLKQIIEKYSLDPDYSEEEKHKLIHNLSKDIEILEGKYNKNQFIKTENFRNFVNNRKLYVWGTGTYAKDLLDSQSSKLEVSLFIESLPKRETFLNKKVISSQALLQLEKDYFILIASSYKEEIVKWLDNHGFERDKDYM